MLSVCYLFVYIFIIIIEGLIMFMSNESSSQLGLSVAAAMTIHNFIEGFLISLPLYYATGSRFAAFSYASLLGGMSQPLGAVLGLLAIRNVDQEQEKFLFGIIFGVVSGMMCLIAMQVSAWKERVVLYFAKLILCVLEYASSSY